MSRLRPLLCLSRTLRSSVNWHGLGDFVAGANPKQEKAWSELKTKDSTVTNVIESARSTVEVVDWKKWEDLIAHKEILEHMKQTYEKNMELLDSAIENEDNSHLEKGWELYESAKLDCSKATSAANRLIADGLKALWVSQRNPPSWKVDTNEWLESDQYWQAFVEKHAMYSQSGTSNDPESPADVEALKKDWNTKVVKFNERTDTPMLYEYMNHLPAWEFYDINRRQFFEHMEYYLLRTGDDFRHFPDLPSWKWLVHLEDLRYRTFQVTQARKKRRQLEKVTRFEPTDLETGEHSNGEEINLQVLLHEKNAIENTLAYLLGNFMFLCDPLVPVTNKFQLQYVLSKDDFQQHQQTKVLSLGDDVNALFVLPYNKELQESSSPLECLHAVLEHHKLSGVKINPSFATRFENMIHIIQQRGPNWLKAPHETVLEAFLRRLRYDDPIKPYIKEYVQEFQARVASAREVPHEKWEEELAKRSHHSYYQRDTSTDAAALLPHEAQVKKLDKDALQLLLDGRHLLARDIFTNEVVTDATKLAETLGKK